MADDFYDTGNCEVVMMEEFDDKTAEKIIQQVKVILIKYERKKNHQKITRTRLYDTLVAEKVLEPDTRRAFDSLMEYAISTEQISERGIKKFKRKKGTKAYTFTKEQLKQLFDVIDRPKVAIACYLTLICGLRINEVCNLRLSDIDLKNCTLNIRDSKNSRRKFDGYGKDRIVKFHSELKEPIEKWIEIIGDTSEWFMPSMTRPDHPIRKKSLHEQYRIFLEKAKLLIPEYSIDVTQRNHGKTKSFRVHRHKYYFHTLRHTYAQIWRDRGGDRDTLQKQLGHEDPATTQKYYDTTEEQISNDISKVFGKADYPIKTTTIREPLTNQEAQIQISPSIEVARLEYEKRKVELEILREKERLALLSKHLIVEVQE